MSVDSEQILIIAEAAGVTTDAVKDWLTRADIEWDDEPREPISPTVLNEFCADIAREYIRENLFSPYIMSADDGTDGSAGK